MSYFIKNNINLFSEEYNPRFQILGHYQDHIKSIEDFKHLMQYNGYKLKNKNFIYDPSSNDPGIYFNYLANGIAARGDLLTFKQYSGGIDYKIVNKEMVSKMQIIAKVGPSNDRNPNLPTFSFKNLNDPQIADYHHGMPDTFNFTEIIYKDIDE